MSAHLLRTADENAAGIQSPLLEQAARSCARSPARSNAMLMRFQQWHLKTFFIDITAVIMGALIVEFLEWVTNSAQQ